MKRTLFILILITYVHTGYGQNTFYSFYDTIPGSAYGSSFQPYLITRCQDGSYAGMANSPGVHTIFRFDDSGNMLWWKRIIYPVSVAANDVTSLSDSSFAISLYVYAQPGYILITKIDLSGNHVWTKSVIKPGGGVTPKSITENGNGGVLITAAASMGQNSLIFLDSSGTIESQSAHVTSLNHTVIVMEAVADSINQFVCAAFIVENGNFAFFRSDNKGDIYNFKEISIPYGLGFGIGPGTKLSTAPDGSHYCLFPTADSIQAFVLFKFDAADQLEWSRYICSPDSGAAGSAIRATADNGCVVSSVNQLSFTPALYVAPILKFDEHGNLSWSKVLGNVSVPDWWHIGVNDILPASNNGWMMPAFRYNTFSILKSDSLFDGFCYNSTGNLNIINFNGISIADSVTKVISSYTIDTLTPLLSPPLPVFRTDLCITVGIKDDLNVNALVNIFPNPFHDELSISVEDNNDYEINIYDIASRKVLKQKFTSSVSLNTKLLTEGIYIYEMRNKDGVVRKGKIVKQ